ncbi:hypothetical protein RAC89_14050 [Paenibacillus sp. GD4]|nr:hypothetical protein [Paenibacillus sp. GD4]MDQ1911550.1 hypothetical protein [Paenibacillus sp. GD4]
MKRMTGLLSLAMVVAVLMSGQRNAKQSRAFRRRREERRRA